VLRTHRPFVLMTQKRHPAETYSKPGGFFGFTGTATNSIWFFNIQIEIHLIDRPEHPFRGIGGVARARPSPPLGNALADGVRVRLRELPLMEPAVTSYVTLTFQKSGATNLRTSRTFFRKAVGWNHSPHGTYVTSLRATCWISSANCFLCV
jgi:hypothetical protein